MFTVVRVSGVVTAIFLLTVSVGCKSSDSQSHWSTRLFYPHADTETLSQTSYEHRQSVEEVARRDRDALMEDLDLLFMTDHPTRLTRWHDR